MGIGNKLILSAVLVTMSAVEITDISSHIRDVAADLTSGPGVSVFKRAGNTLKSALERFIL